MSDGTDQKPDTGRERRSLGRLIPKVGIPGDDKQVSQRHAAIRTKGCNIKSYRSWASDINEVWKVEK